MPENGLVLSAPVIAVLGDNIDTDLIYPGRYLNITDRERTAEHLFELAWPAIRDKASSGGFLVAGRNFGCGSSREQAAAALKYAGITAVIAASFARIFYRNAINLGLPLLIAPEAAGALREGDLLEADLVEGSIVRPADDMRLQAGRLDPRAVELLLCGGLISYLKRKHANVQVSNSLVAR